MLLQDAFEPLGSNSTVPDSIRIDDKPGTAGADAKACRFGPHHFYLCFFHSLLDVIPERFSIASLTAVGSDADE